MATLGTLVSTPEERQTLTDAAEELRRYRALAERPPGERGAPEQAALRLEALAERLYAQSSTELRRRGAMTEALDEQGRLVALLAVGTSLAMAARHRRVRELANRPPPARAQGRGAGDRAPQALRAHSRPWPRRDRRSDDRLQPDGHAAPRAGYPQAAPLLGDHPRPQDAAHGHRLVRGPAGDGSARRAREASGVARPEHPHEHQSPPEPREPASRPGKAQDRQAPAGSRSDRRRRPWSRSAVDEVRPWAEDRGLRFAITVSDSIPKLLLDAKRIHQVLVNLLANAVKFSGAGGLITLTAEVSGHGAPAEGGRHGDRHPGAPPGGRSSSATSRPTGSVTGRAWAWRS